MPAQLNLLNGQAETLTRKGRPVAGPKQLTIDGVWEPAKTKRNPFTLEREATDEAAGKTAR